MANRRMFSNRIANSARFLQMPEGAQVLYFHMVLRADDDGVVEVYPLIKLLGSAPDNFKVLSAKQFIRQLNEDQVSVIVDWLEHNVIRADRKVNSIYAPLLDTVAPDMPRIAAKPRSDVEDNSNRVGGPSTDGISKVRLGKVRLGQDNKTKPCSSPLHGVSVPVSPSAGTIGNEIIFAFKDCNPSYEQLYKRKPQHEAAERLARLHGPDKVKKAIAFATGQRGDRFCPSIATPIQLEEKWSALEKYAVGLRESLKGKLKVGAV